MTHVSKSYQHFLDTLDTIASHLDRQGSHNDGSWTTQSWRVSWTEAITQEIWNGCSPGYKGSVYDVLDPRLPLKADIWDRFFVRPFLASLAPFGTAQQLC